jgi:hypothetical protein
MENELMVNGKYYPLWSQFIEKKQEWIGGVLFDEGDYMGRLLGMKLEETEIVDIALTPNGKKSAYFEIVGKKYSCGFDVERGGISGNQFGEPWLEFSSLDGIDFRIKKANA